MTDLGRFAGQVRNAIRRERYEAASQHLGEYLRELNEFTLVILGEDADIDVGRALYLVLEAYGVSTPVAAACGRLADGWLRGNGQWCRDTGPDVHSIPMSWHILHTLSKDFGRLIHTAGDELGAIDGFQSAFKAICWETALSRACACGAIVTDHSGNMTVGPGFPPLPDEAEVRSAYDRLQATNTRELHQTHGNYGEHNA